MQGCPSPTQGSVVANTQEFHKYVGGEAGALPPQPAGFVLKLLNFKCPELKFWCDSFTEWQGKKYEKIDPGWVWSLPLMKQIWAHNFSGPQLWEAWIWSKPLFLRLLI